MTKKGLVLLNSATLFTSELVFRIISSKFEVHVFPWEENMRGIELAMWARRITLLFALALVLYLMVSVSRKHISIKFFVILFIPSILLSLLLIGRS